MKTMLNLKTTAIALLGLALLAPQATSTPTKPSPNSRIHKRHLSDRKFDKGHNASPTKECTKSKRTSKKARHRTKSGGRWHYRKR